MNNYKTPGVHIEELSLLPPTIVQTSTAIPVFLGYTKNQVNEPVRISSFKEYEDIFGGAYEYTFSYTQASGEYTVTAPTMSFFLYEAIRLYFLNGGGACYILSVGSNQSASLDAQDFIDAIPEIEKLDEPTLIVFPEASGLSDIDDYASIANAALMVCENTKDKFTLLDSLSGKNFTDANNNSLSNFRSKITGNGSYGAAYFPHLKTAIKAAYSETGFPNSQTVDYQKLTAAIQAKSNMIIAPSAIMAGVYAKVDRDRGVWKAPANVALQGVIEPEFSISDSTQGNLNIDATSGKSVNAIRSFTGKGTIVWGARTLDGNSNEWRYINVRRLFMTVEESVKKATGQFVFENNNSKTWVKVSAMVQSYLNGLWKEGALVGAAAEEAYFVQVGLGTTMTEQDVLEGKMIVKIGLATVRPAEFVVLQFSHFLNQ